MSDDYTPKPDQREEDWPNFWFEGNQAWGWIESRADWEWLVGKYASGWGDDGYGAKERVLAGRNLPGAGRTFGLYAEYRGEKTLADWFSSHGVTP